MRRGSILQLALLAILAGVITTLVAVLIPWMPEQASKEAQRINDTFWFMTWISVVVFAVVVAVLAYALIHFRVKPGDLSDGPPIHGHTGLEIVWTAIPFLLVTALAAVSAVVLSKNSDAGPNPVKVTAIAQQFAWQFQYPNGKTYPILRLPVGEKVQLTLKAKDVLHSFWVPQLYQKQDAIPGLPTELTITPIHTGVFPVICVELCGLGHSTMRSEADVMSAADYDAWLAKESAPAPAGGGGGAADAAATFNNNGCGGCHTFSAIPGASGKVGPDLDQLKAQATTAGQPLNDFIKESIVNPDTYIEPTYAKGVMPPGFGDSIPADKLDGLVQYLADNAK